MSNTTALVGTDRLPHKVFVRMAGSGLAAAVEVLKDTMRASDALRADVALCPGDDNPDRQRGDIGGGQDR